MTHAQRILQASHAILHRLRQEQITLHEAWLRAYYERIEAWCVQAQVQEGVTHGD